MRLIAFALLAVIAAASIFVGVMVYTCLPCTTKQSVATPPTESPRPSAEVPPAPVEKKPEPAKTDAAVESEKPAELPQRRVRKDSAETKDTTLVPEPRRSTSDRRDLDPPSRRTSFEPRDTGRERIFRGSERVLTGTDRVRTGTERIKVGTEAVERCTFSVNQRTGEKEVITGNCD